MAPSGRGKTRSTKRSRTISFKKPKTSEAEASACLDRLEKHAKASTSLDHEAEASALTADPKAEASASFESSEVIPSKIDGVKFENGYFCGCSTPKAKKFRIPEISTCPPAPKKQRPGNPNFNSIRRNPISFFAPPDLELFFFFAVQDIPVRINL